MTPEQIRSQAMQDQEIAEAAAWLDESDPSEVAVFFAALNDDLAGDRIRAMDDDAIASVRHLALIGFFEAVKSAANRSA